MLLAPAGGEPQGRAARICLRSSAPRASCACRHGRCHGKVHELDAVPKLDKNKKHTVEVVVDRLKVRADVKQRLAESFETALRHGDGRAIALPTWSTNAGDLFSSQVRLPAL